MKAALGRPVVGRLLEPLAWAIGLGAALPALDADGAATALRAFALFLVTRLLVDTAPNLHGAALLEAEPYDRRPLVRALVRVKLTLALASALAVFVAVHFTPSLSALAGGVTNVWVVHLALLISYAMETPVLREHRGFPIARPAVGPGIGAVLFAVTVVAAAPPTASSLLVRAVACVVCGNLLGLARRFREAARQLDKPLDTWALADPRTRELVRPRAERSLARRAVATWPLLLLPVWPAVCLVLAGGTTEARPAIVAALVASLPAILFDVARPSARLAAASLGAALGLAALSFGSPSTSASPIAAMAALALVHPPAGLLLARGYAPALVAGATAVLLARALLTVAPDSFPTFGAWPLPELLGSIGVTAAALVAVRGRRA